MEGKYPVDRTKQQVSTRSIIDNGRCKLMLNLKQTCTNI